MGQGCLATACLTKRPGYLHGDKLRIVPNDECGEAQHPVPIDGQFVVPLHVFPPGTSVHMPTPVDLHHEARPLPYGIQPSASLLVHSLELAVRLGEPKAPDQVAEVELG